LETLLGSIAAHKGLFNRDPRHLRR
jgi:hypothetical protein